MFFDYHKIIKYIFLWNTFCELKNYAHICSVLFHYYTILEIKNITFSYGRHRPLVLDNFSANFRDGGIYGLLGRNGAGKSTLLYLTADLLTPKSGQVYHNGTSK